MGRGAENDWYLVVEGSHRNLHLPPTCHPWLRRWRRA